MKIRGGRIAAAVVALATIGYGIAEFRGPNGYTGFLQRREEAKTLERDNKQLREELDRLDARVYKLKHDPDAQELEIRKRLGLAKSGETVYLLQDKQRSTAVSAPAASAATRK